jgi:hypothetical protein
MIEGDKGDRGIDACCPTSAPCGTRLITDQTLINLLNNSTQVRYQYNSDEGNVDITIPWSSSIVYRIEDRLTFNYPFVHLGLKWNSSTNILYYTSYDEALLASVVMLPIGKTADDCVGINIASTGNQNPIGGTVVNINGISYTCGQYCELPFPISPTSVSLTFL